MVVMVGEISPHVSFTDELGLERRMVRSFYVLSFLFLRRLCLWLPSSLVPIELAAENLCRELCSKFRCRESLSALLFVFRRPCRDRVAAPSLSRRRLSFVRRARRAASDVSNSAAHI